MNKFDNNLIKFIATYYIKLRVKFKYRVFM